MSPNVVGVPKWPVDLLLAIARTSVVCARAALVPRVVVDHYQHDEYNNWYYYNLDYVY